MKKSIIISLLVSLVFVFTGCEAEEGESNSEQFYTIGGGSTGGVFEGAASGFALLFSNESDDISASSQTTTGGGQNIELMASGELDMAIADSLVAQQAYEGEGQFEDDPNTEIAAIGNVYPTYFQQLVHPNSNISSMNDLEGRTLVVGGPGSGTELATNIVYEAHNYDYTDNEDINPEYVGISEGADQMRNLQVDGMTSITPYPFAAFTELTMADDGELISLDQEAIESLAEETVYIPGTIPAGTYDNQEDDIETVMMQTMLIADSNLDEETVYNFTKFIFENIDYLQNQHNAFSDLSIESATDELSIPLHPGAERYYEEQGAL